MSRSANGSTSGRARGKPSPLKKRGRYPDPSDPLRPLPAYLFRKYGIRQAELLLAPEIEDLLGSMALGGLKTCLQAMRYSQDPIIVQFLEKFDKATGKERRDLHWQGFVLACGLDFRTFVGSVIMAVREYSVNQVKLLALTQHPEIMKARIANAKSPKGVKDRDAIDTMLGALPSPKGATFINKQYIAPGKNGAGKEEPDDDDTIDAEDVDLDTLFPPLQDTQKLIEKSGTKLLAAATKEEELADLEAQIDGAAVCIPEE